MKKGLMVLLALLVVGSVMFAVDPVLGDTGNVILKATNGSKTILTIDQEELGDTTKINLAVDSTDGFLSGVKIGSWSVLSTHPGTLTLKYQTTAAGFTSANLTTAGLTNYTVPYYISIDGGDNYSSSVALATAAATYSGSFTRGDDGAYLDDVNTNNILVKRFNETDEYAAATDYTSTITLEIYTN